MGINFFVPQPVFVNLTPFDLVTTGCCSNMPPRIKGEISLMKNTWSTFELYRALLPGVVSHFSLGYAVLKSAYLPKRHIDSFVSVSSVVKCISLTMGLGSCISCLREEALKSCGFLVKALHNVCLIALVIPSVTDPRHLCAISFSSRAVRSGTAEQALVHTELEVLGACALALPSALCAVCLVCLSSEQRNYTDTPLFLLDVSSTSPSSIVINTVMKEIELMGF